MKLSLVFVIISIVIDIVRNNIHIVMNNRNYPSEKAVPHWGKFPVSSGNLNEYDYIITNYDPSPPRIYSFCFQGG